MFGSPSALTKDLGNPHQHLFKARAFLYHNMGQKKKVNEIIPVWDKTKGEVEWKTSKVRPNEVMK